VGKTESSFPRFVLFKRKDKMKRAKLKGDLVGPKRHYESLLGAGFEQNGGTGKRRAS